MESLKILNKECIKLLEKNNLLINLVTQEYRTSLVDESDIENDKILELKNVFRSDNDLEDDERFEDWLKKSNYSEKEFINKLSFKYKINEYSREKFRHQTNAYFLKNKKDFDKVTYSLLRVDDLFTAQELYQRVKDSESTFGELAKNYSLGPEKYALGVVGPIPINQSHPNIVEMISGHKVGELIPPFKVESWWVILRIEFLIEATLDAAMEDHIVNTLFTDWLLNKANQKIKDLKNEIIQN
tara:strand:- start:72 stop:797 length:726 start_codon:yes stop_codon:yes gene_type:complete